MNKLEKPVTIIKKELEESIIKQINESKLPMFIIEYILKDLLNGIHSASQQQLELDIKNYEAALKQCSDAEVHNSEKNKK